MAKNQKKDNRNYINKKNKPDLSLIDNHTNEPIETSQNVLPFYLKGYMPYIVFVVFGFLIFSHTITYDYSYLDDHILIRNNFQKINKISDISQAFKEDAFHSKGKGFYYRPMLTVSLILDAIISKTDNLAFYRFMNILQHTLVVCLFFYLLLMLGFQRFPSFFFSFLILIHPIIVQAIVWVPGRNDILLALWCILSMIFFIKYLQTKNPSSFFLHILFFIYSLLTKESAVLLPVLLLFYFYTLYKQRKVNILILIILWIIITVLFLYIRNNVLGGSNGYSLSESISYIFNNSLALLSYVCKVIIPLKLAQYPIMQDLTLSIIIGGIIVILLGILFYYSRKKNKMLMLMGIIWFLIFMIPGLIISTEKSANFSEHRAYLPLFGISIFLLSSKITSFISLKNKTFKIIAIILIITFSLINLVHSFSYKNPITFWQSAVKSSPHHAFNYNNLGAMYYMNKDFLNAEKYFIGALTINPNEPLANGNLGLVLLNMNRLSDAEPYLLKEIKINPKYDNGYFNLGVYYFAIEQNNAGVYYMEEAIKINPYYSLAYKNLDMFYTKISDMESLQRLRARAQMNGLVY